MSKAVSTASASMTGLRADVMVVMPCFWSFRTVAA